MYEIEYESKLMQSARTLREIEIAALIMIVAPMDKGGFFSCGANADY
jgi:hypothetical protein